MHQDGVSEKCCVSELLEASSSFSAPIIVRLWLLTVRKPRCTRHRCSGVLGGLAFGAGLGSGVPAHLAAFLPACSPLGGPGP